MNRVCSIVVLVGSPWIAFLAASWVQVDRDVDERERVRLEEQFAEARTRRDVVFLQPFLADDFLGHGVRREALTKADVTGRFQLPGCGVSSIRHADIRGRVFGDCAVATARSLITGSYEGRDIGGQFYYLYVLLKRNGRWQVVAAHSTPLAGGTP